jgi:hypothetical protein
VKKNTNILLMGGVLLIGIFAVAATLLPGNSSSNKKSDAFSLNQMQAAGELNVSMPPAPTSPSSSVTASSTSKAKVTGAAKTAPVAISDICTGSDSANFDCYQSYYQNIVRTKGTAAAFTDLKARYQKNSYVQSQCHPLTHVIGRTSAEKFSKVSEAYTEGDSFCWSGYYHGVLETFAHRIGLQNLPGQMNNICADLNSDGKYGFNYYNCVHGLGHGLMAITDDQLFKSLDYCNGLKGDWEEQSCAGGVYMENVIADGLNHVTNYLDPKRPLYPCSDSPDKYKNTCYLMQTSYMLKIDGGDFSKTFQWCRDAGQYLATCDQSLGREPLLFREFTVHYADASGDFFLIYGKRLPTRKSQKLRHRRARRRG